MGTEGLSVPQVYVRLWVCPNQGAHTKMGLLFYQIPPPSQFPALMASLCQLRNRSACVSITKTSLPLWLGNHSQESLLYKIGRAHV